MTQCFSKSEGSLSVFFYLTTIFWKFNFYSVSYGLQLSRAFSYYSAITSDMGSLFPRQLQVYCVKRFHFQSDRAHCYKRNVDFFGGQGLQLHDLTVFQKPNHLVSWHWRYEYWGGHKLSLYCNVSLQFFPKYYIE